MPDASRLEQLENEPSTLGEGAMLVEELGGFVAGLVVCPDLIQASEWLPIIFGISAEGSWPAFDDLDHANRVFGLWHEEFPLDRNAPDLHLRAMIRAIFVASRRPIEFPPDRQARGY